MLFPEWRLSPLVFSAVKVRKHGSPPKALHACLSKSSSPALSSRWTLVPSWWKWEHLTSQGHRGGLCLYKASNAGPRAHCKVIKHFVIARYINSQQSSGITFPSFHSVWPVSLDFLLALFQIQMECVNAGGLSWAGLWGLFWTWSRAFPHLSGR